MWVFISKRRYNRCLCKAILLVAIDSFKTLKGVSYFSWDCFWRNSIHYCVMTNAFIANDTILRGYHFSMVTDAFHTIHYSNIMCAIRRHTRTSARLVCFRFIVANSIRYGDLLSPPTHILDSIGYLLLFSMTFRIADDIPLLLYQ